MTCSYSDNGRKCQRCQGRPEAWFPRRTPLKLSEKGSLSSACTALSAPVGGRYRASWSLLFVVYQKRSFLVHLPLPHQILAFSQEYLGQNPCQNQSVKFRGASALGTCHHSLWRSSLRGKEEIPLWRTQT